MTTPPPHPRAGMYGSIYTVPIYIYVYMTIPPPLLRAQESLSRAAPGGKDLLGISRGGCKTKECACVGYVQRHTSNAVLLQVRFWLKGYRVKGALQLLSNRSK